MNPGMGDISMYNKYKTYMKQIGRLSELDGININNESFMNQQQQKPKQDLFGTSTSTKPKQDLFGTSTSTKPKQDLFGTSNTTTTTNKVNFFDNNSNQNANNSNLYSSQISSNQNTQNNTGGTKKIGLFDSIPQGNQNLSKSTNVEYNSNINEEVVNKGNVTKRQFFDIDESAEIDGTEFVLANKKKSQVFFSEKILKKSDNMTKFNRKNRSEGNKHILNAEL
jgi:hypothetical protein